jgi:hypothetical protein
MSLKLEARRNKKLLENEERGVLMKTLISSMVHALPAHAFGRLQSATGEELRPLFGRTLLPSVLDKAFKGEL